jgi:hypothetical protein
MVARAADAAISDMPIVVPARRVDLFREEEPGDAVTGFIVVSVRDGERVHGALVKRVESESNGDLAGDIIVRDRNRSGENAGIDADLSLIDDLFADLSLLP